MAPRVIPPPSTEQGANAPREHQQDNSASSAAAVVDEDIYVSESVSADHSDSWSWGAFQDEEHGVVGRTTTPTTPSTTSAKVTRAIPGNLQRQSTDQTTTTTTVEQLQSIADGNNDTAIPSEIRAGNDENEISIQSLLHRLAQERGLSLVPDSNNDNVNTIVNRSDSASAQLEPENDQEEKEQGEDTLANDTYSFFMIVDCRSIPFLYAIALVAFQTAAFSLVGANMVDASNPANPLGIPVRTKAT
jgi:hypothetical protein